MKTLNCHFGLKLIGILLILLISCSQKRERDEMVCNLSWLGDNNILISLRSNTTDSIFMPAIRPLIAGIRIFKIKKNNSIDVTGNFREEIGKNLSYYMTEICKVSYDPENDFVNYPIDSIINVVYKFNYFLCEEDRPMVRDLIYGILKIKPNHTIQACFKLPAAFSRDTLVIFYQYPYKSVWDYQTLSEDLKTIVAKYERIRLPDEILGYKRYKNVVLQSNYLIYYPSN